MRNKKIFMATLVVFVLIAGCTRCPMRMFDWQQKTCEICGQRYCELDGAIEFHKCPEFHMSKCPTCGIKYGIVKNEPMHNVIECQRRGNKE